MKTFVMIGIFLVALALEWIAEAATAGSRVDIPLAAASAILGLWVTSSGQRVIFAVFAGTILDLFTLAPIGTYTLMLLAFSWLAAFFRSIFSETDAVLSGVIGGGILFFLLLVGLHPMSALLRFTAREISSWNSRDFGFSAATAAIWALVFTSLTYATYRAFWKPHR